MLSEEQLIAKRNRVKKIVDLFLLNPKSLKDLAAETQTPFSTIQRDLNDAKTIKEIYGEKAQDIIVTISQKLSENKQNGLRKGGITSTQKNESLRDEKGHFKGCRK